MLITITFQTKSNGSVVETVDAVDNVENDGETCDKNDDANVNRSYNFDVKTVSKSQS